MIAATPAALPWGEVWGQDDALGQLQAAASDPAQLAHAWLITGPAGSGRSTLAAAAAAALIAEPGDEAATRQVLTGTHPDLTTLRTEGVIISIKDARALVERSYFSPSLGRYRVMVVEDADRMVERTSNVLLKALEEPPPRTVWVLCAPSDADLVPTIRSRVRTVRLRTPSVADVAELIERRDAVPAADALRAAREAQSHVGMAHRLATDPHARERRVRSLELALGIRTVAGAVAAAAELLDVAGEDARAVTEERDAREREDALRYLGVESGGTVPPQLRAQIKALEDDQKRRATRSLRDGLDRILIDLTSLYRDVLLLQLGAGLEPVNAAIAPALEAAARECGPEHTLATLDALAEARERLEGNVAPALVLEAALVSAVRPRVA